MKQLTGCEKLSQSMPHTVDAQKFSADVLGFEDEAPKAEASAVPQQ